MRLSVRCCRTVKLVKVANTQGYNQSIVYKNPHLETLWVLQVQWELQKFLHKHPHAPSHAPITSRYNPNHDKPF